MANLRKGNDFYDVITGIPVDKNEYGMIASAFKKVDNIELVFDSHGNYLGIRTSRGKFENGIYTIKKGPYDFKSFTDLKIWAGKRCCSYALIETREGISMQVDILK